MKISSFATELRTYVLVYVAYSYLYVYRDVPSEGVFYLPGIYLAVHVWGRWPLGCWPVATFAGRGVQPLLQPLGQTPQLLSYQWSSMSWLPGGAHMPWLEKPVVHEELAASHTSAHSTSKDIPSPSKCEPKSLDCYCFPALDSLSQGFILLSPPNEFSSPVEILHFFPLKFSTLCNLKKSSM